MTTLYIKDLAIATELDRAAMASVAGGCYYKQPSCWTPPSYCQPGYGMPESKYQPTSFSFDATQQIGQSQNVVNNNGNNVAFASGISSTVNPTQSANNNINF
ncbi:hypothetical protein [Noviherbaspirillum denitrificans]|uniref:Uncharacterized protein n=1 Tax=Noviherbaspirillum denitrificans TaxID=1968433 RepID=A0A254TB58_9BURK|nr:hypothetical protein [Noviherbaspirillum denitrificans]OWW19890.1 hypothetical protein AYR66_10625 [Noviherbaspirillum denitrificans]